MLNSCYPELFLLIIGCAVFTAMKSKKRKENLEKRFRIFFAAVFVLYCAAFIYYALFSRNYSIRALNLKPFESYSGVLTDYGKADVFNQMIGNVLAFIPIAFLLPMAFNMPSGIKTYAAVILFCAIFSGTTEFIQYQFLLGYTEADDLINNVSGAVIGCGVYSFSCRVERKKNSIILKKGWLASLMPALIYAFIIFLIVLYRELILNKR